MKRIALLCLLTGLAGCASQPERISPTCPEPPMVVMPTLPEPARRDFMTPALRMKSTLKQIETALQP